MNPQDQAGTILDVKRYAIHDGPGIRTTVFLKGCPLACEWCHNPESQRERPEILYYKERCTLCKACVSACNQDALEVVDDGLLLDQSVCIGCGDCVPVCPNGARELAGRVMNVGQVVSEVVKDTLFYEESGGGVTFSGGEPLMQADFVRAIASRCAELDIHTALDTSGYASEFELRKVADLIDLFLYDIKTLDDAAHIAYTGVSNRSILRNLRSIDEMGKRIW
ncbi:glycyl-radical enzyme activating protein, partial [Candidatus Bipolaricaulota bacterium]|nr:glycyl-radical enzyme activating protein [Candidatus Bipolaricaulota bacterium]